jgi:hypothetical protein
MLGRESSHMDYRFDLNACQAVFQSGGAVHSLPNCLLNLHWLACEEEKGGVWRAKPAKHPLIFPVIPPIPIHLKQ